MIERKCNNCINYKIVNHEDVNIESCEKYLLFPTGSHCFEHVFNPEYLRKNKIERILEDD